MPQGRRRVGRSFQRGSRPNLEWSEFSDVVTNVPGPSTKVLLTGFTSTVALDTTILRTRLNLFVVSDQLAAIEQQMGAFGAVIVNNDAFAVGVTAVPGPISDISADWFVYQPFANQFTFIDATGFQSMSAGEYVVDSKAKRILEPDESVAVVIETQSDSEGLSVMYQGRILTQLRGTR